MLQGGILRHTLGLLHSPLGEWRGVLRIGNARRQRDGAHAHGQGCA
jgi:hypothetical protein